MRTNPQPETGPIAAARQAFERFTGRAPRGVTFAPGRVNLIGEHTDYNDGFVLPMAIPQGIAAAFAPRSDMRLRVHASDFGARAEAALPDLADRTVPVKGWFRYAAGVAWSMMAAGLPLSGADIAVAADLPSGAGLSSSAALEMAVARALCAAADIHWDPRAIAAMAQRAEHEFAGVACGIMDQMVVACATDGHALLLDCRTLATTDVALPDNARIVVMNSGVRRSLSGSEYNDRRAACERAVAAVQRFAPDVRALRDVDETQLARARDGMDDTAYRRAAHVVAENRRPAEFVDAAARADLAVAGRAMLASHESLRVLYEVSCPELDALVELSMAQRGCHGARLTGAGFGGCAIALVEADAVGEFVPAVTRGYAARTSRTAALTVSRASAGARMVA